MIFKLILNFSDDKIKCSYLLCILSGRWFQFCLVARKKFDNVSLLHVYHHSIMPINVWFGVRFIPGGHGTFFGLINAFVHIIMYTYYLISGLGPRFKKYVWWKIYVTKLQLSQFGVVLLHSAQLVPIKSVHTWNNFHIKSCPWKWFIRRCNTTVNPLEALLM